MKQVMALVFLLSLIQVVFAQGENRKLVKLYGTIGGGPAANNGAAATGSLTAVFRKGWTVGATYHNIDLNPKGIPSDYKQGYTFLLGIPLPDAYPSATLRAYSLTAGKAFAAGKRVWFTTEAGLSLVSGPVFTFTRQQVTDNGFYVSSNYAAKEENKTTVGALLQADANWALASFLGLSVGGFANLNSIQSPVGLQFRLLVGKLRSRQ